MPVIPIERIADGTLVLAKSRRAFALPPGWTLRDVPLGVLAGTPGGPGEVTGYVQLVPPSADPLTGAQAFPVVPTTDATVTTVATLPTPVPAGGTLYFEGLLIAVLAAGQVNANLGGPITYRIAASAARIGSATSITGSDPSASSKISAPFLPFGSGPSHGTAGLSSSGDYLQVNAIGFSVKEAWTSGHAYVAGDASTTPGDFVTANGNVYLCTGSGTASGSAPSGTGTGLGTGATFAYVGPGSAIPINWTFMLTMLVTGS